MNVLLAEVEAYQAATCLRNTLVLPSISAAVLYDKGCCQRTLATGWECQWDPLPFALVGLTSNKGLVGIIWYSTYQH